MYTVAAAVLPNALSLVACSMSYELSVISELAVNNWVDNIRFYA